MTTTIRLSKELVNKINALEGKSQNDKIERLITTKCSNADVVKCSNPSDIENEILTNLNLLLKAFNGIQEGQHKIEEALRAHVFELNMIRTELENR